MRNKIRLMLVLALMSPVALFAAEAGETKLEGTVRARNTSAFDAEGEYDANYTSIERGYLTVKHNVTENIKTRLTLDAVSSSKTAEGASIRLKYAYADFTKAIGPMGIRAGLASNRFAMTRDISSSFIYYKAGAEKWFGNPSTDYGVTLHGEFAEMLELEVQGVNGSGYKKIAADKETKYPDLIANARITPIEAVMVGLSYKYDKAEEGDINNSILAPHLKISTDYIDIPVETVINIGDSTTYNGRTFSLYVQPEFKLKKLAGIPLSFGGGFGMLTNKDEAENATVVMGGLRYDLVKNVKLQASYVNDITDGESTGADLMFQVEYKFKKLLN